MHGGRHNGNGRDVIKYIASQDGRKYWTCTECKAMFVATNPVVEHVCRLVQQRPGTELTKIFHAAWVQLAGRASR